MRANGPFQWSQRMLIVLLAATCAAGFGIGAYYSKSDWHHPAYWAPEWPHPDRNVNYDTAEHPEKWAEFVGFTHRIVGELMTGYGPVDILFHLLVDIVAKGGNFLLNVGPDADGELPAPALERMEAIGRWMRVNGEAIYGTRATPPYKAGNVCLTKKGGAVYAIVLAAEGETRPPESFVAPGVRSAARVRMLGSGGPVMAVPGPAGLVVAVPAAARETPPCEHAWAFEITAAAFLE